MTDHGAGREQEPGRKPGAGLGSDQPTGRTRRARTARLAPRTVAVLVAGLLVAGGAGVAIASGQPRGAQPRTGEHAAARPSGGQGSGQEARPGSGQPGHAKGAENSKGAAKSQGAGHSKGAAKSDDDAKPADSRVPATAADKDSSPRTWPRAHRKARSREDSGVGHFMKGFRSTGASSSAPRRGKENKGVDSLKTPDFKGLAQGAALEELNAAAAENAENGWKLGGEQKVLGDVQVVDLDEKTARVFACIDSSAITITDGSGTQIQKAVSPGSRAALNVFDVRTQDGQSIVINHTLAEESQCK